MPHPGSRGPLTKRKPESRRAPVASNDVADDRQPTEEALRITRFSVEHAVESIFWVGPDARLLYGNRSFCRLLGYSHKEILSLHIWDIVPEIKQSLWPARWKNLKEQRSTTSESAHCTKAGEHFPVEMSLNYAQFGGIEYLFVFSRDIRHRKSAEARLKESEQRYRILFESSNDAILLVEDGIVVDCNSRALKLFDVTKAQILTDFDKILQSREASIHALMGRALVGEIVTFPVQLTSKHGLSGEIECTLTDVPIDGKMFLLAVVDDVTERRSVDRSLSQLSGRLLQLQDEERRRIARELHDTTGQNLGALQINLALAAMSAKKLDQRAREALQEGLALAQVCVREIRTMSYLLHPPLLDELGLVSALRSYADGYSGRTGIALRLDLPSRMDRLPQEIEIALFRIVQEGLANIHRHSGSLSALLRLRRRKDSITLELADYGRGIPGNLDLTAPEASRIGVGIAGMRERTRQLGGRMTISSSSAGTTLQVVLPATVSTPKEVLKENLRAKSKTTGI